MKAGSRTDIFVIVVTSLHRDFLPSSCAMYLPTWVDISLYAGTICFFGMNFLLFLKFLPAIAITEVKEFNHELRHEPKTGAPPHGAGEPAVPGPFGFPAPVPGAPRGGA